MVLSRRWPSSFRAGKMLAIETGMNRGETESLDEFIKHFSPELVLKKKTIPLYAALAVSE
ncbi:MAG: hypothetical protein IAA97_02615 [Spirochaetes bacterium]|uniref:Uncharacterized protein n=1 Tax=Candidatus Ornithospirochaeta stercoripullorum TaxID=2840899 RepID=A0A9D9DYJ1_9SPIO|nr:hypothetical protein [Candidatus Ornithospirochaeta stercoripullorum]